MAKASAAAEAKKGKGPSARVVSLADLVPDPANVRAHTKRGAEAIGASVRELGAARSIVVDKDGVVRAGNGTLEAAKAAGLTEAILVETDGKQLVVVKRPDWTAEQAIAYAIADNRTGELSGWDKGALAEALTGLADKDPAMVAVVEAAGFDPATLRNLLAAGMPPAEGGGAMPGQPATGAQGGFRYSVIVDFSTEQEQAGLLAELEQRGMACRLMIS